MSATSYDIFETVQLLFLIDFFTTDIEIDDTGFARKTEYQDIAMLAKIGGIVEHVDCSRIFLATLMSR